MRFVRQLPNSSLIALCRTMRHNLDAGLSIVRVFEQLAGKGDAALKPVAARIVEVLKHGDTLEEALKKEEGFFPFLFVAMARVGERSGTLPRVMKELEKYYTLMQSLRRKFLSQSFMPALQLFFAVFIVIPGVYLLHEAVSGSTGAPPMDPLGIGVGGSRGAVRWLTGVMMVAGTLVGTYLFLTRVLSKADVVHETILRIPALGGVVRALTMMRFCLALRLTLDTSMPIARAVGMSLEATGNAAFANRSKIVSSSLKSGDHLSEALANARIFQDDFLMIVATAEEGGRVPEVMEHQAKYFEEEAEMKMMILNRVASFGIWATVAIILVIMIIRMAMSAYGPIFDLI